MEEGALGYALWEWGGIETESLETGKSVSKYREGKMEEVTFEK